MYLLFDIGATQLRMGVSRKGKKIDTYKIVHTPSTFKEGTATIQKLARELSNGAPYIGAAGGIAGPLNVSHSQLVSSSHLPGWAKKPLKNIFSRVVQGPILFENDAALAGLGESLYGAGKGARIVAYYTVSTGVGGARIVDGKLDVRSIGFEPGHQIIKLPHHSRKRHHPLYLEEYVSGSGLMMRYQKDPKDLHESSVWREVEEYLAYGLNNSIVHWSPDVVVLGGGIITNGPVSIPAVRDHLKRVMTIFKPPPLKKAVLGDIGGLHGALAYVKQFLIDKVYEQKTGHKRYEHIHNAWKRN